jgi:hypothetical protein
MQLDRKQMNYFVEIIGWIGAVLIIGAYYLNINGKIKSTSAWYIIYWAVFSLPLTHWFIGLTHQ